MAAKKYSKQPAKPQISGRSVPARNTPEVQSSFFKIGFFQEHRIPALVLVGIAVALYGMTVGFGYLQDDQLVIWDNAFVQKGFAGLREIFSGDSLLGYYKDPKLLFEGGRYRPLPLATFALEIGMFGKDHPGIAHGVNVLLYGASGVLLYRILSALFPQEAPTNGVWFWSIPFWAAAIFMLHPLHTEVVANIKGRDEILALLGSLGALYSAMKYGDTGENRWLAFSGVALFFGLLSKENAATFLAVIPLTLWMFSKISLRRIVLVGSVLLGAIFLFTLVRFKALGYLVRPSNPVDELVLNPFLGMGVGEKFATIFLTLGWYLKLFVFPYPLTIDYYPYHVPKVTWSDWRPILALAVHIVLVFWALRQVFATRNRKDNTQEQPAGKDVAAYCILFYVLTVSVVSNIFVSTSTFMNERYLYMPSVGLALLLAWFLLRTFPEWLAGRVGAPRMVAAMLAGFVGLLFAWRVLVRVPDWGGDGSALVENAIRVSPGSYRANYYYGAMLYEKQFVNLPNNAADERKKLIGEIDRCISKSLEINPDYRLAGTLKVSVAAAKYAEDRQLAALLETLEDLTKKQPYNGDMLVRLLEVLRSLKGSDPNLYNRFCHRVGFELYFKQKGDLNGGAEFLNLALNNYPQDPNILQDLVELYGAMGNPQKTAEMQQRLQMLQNQ